MQNFTFKKKPFFIAELSANHAGSLARAKKLILASKKYGADAVKIQSYTPDSITLKSKRREFKIKKGLWKGSYLWDLYSSAQTPYKWHKELFEFAKKNDILCFSSPFDENAVDMLEKLNCPFYKLASFEINHIPLIIKIAKTRKPIIISTGMASLKEIDLAIKYAKKYGAKKIIILYCVSNYPSKYTDFNFKNISILKKRYNCTIGFSDHSTDFDVATAAILSGAQVIEKHVALKNQKKGTDIEFSTKGEQIKKYRETIDKAYLMLGKNKFYTSKIEKEKIIYRRSIYAIKNINIGEKFSINNIKVVRPNLGLDPKWYFKILNKRSKNNYKKNIPIKKDEYK